MKKNKWLKKISEADGARKDWQDSAKECWERFCGKKEQPFNIMKSTTDVLLGSLFNEMPKPDIRQRFTTANIQDDFKANLYAKAATVADRCVQYNNDITRAKENFSKCFQDAFITGQGVVQVSYDYEDDGEVVSSQKAPIEYIRYDKYVEEVCDSEEEITWKAHCFPMTKQAAAKEFDKAVGDFTTSLKVGDDSNAKTFVKVYEVWDKSTKTRTYVSPDYNKQELRVDKDPLGLQGFFPYEVFKTIANGVDTIPTADFAIWKNINDQLQDAVRRRNKLTSEQIKYRPLFDNSAGQALKDAFNSAEGDAVPLAKSPQEDVLSKVGAIPTLEAQNIVMFLEERIKRYIEEIYDITGISDILRGSTDARETAAAQRVKGVFGSLRLKPRQEGVQEVVKNVYRKQSEIICEKYTTQQMEQVSCIDVPAEEEKAELQFRKVKSKEQMTPQGQIALKMGIEQPVKPVTVDEANKLTQPTIDNIAALLRNDKMRGYSIDIETTATIFDDIETQRNQIQMFTQNLFTMFNQTAQYVQATPSVVDLMEQMTLLNISQFKVSRGYTDSIKEVFTNIKAEITAPKEEKPDPAMIKVKADSQSKMMEAQAEMLKVKAEAQNDTRVTDIKQQEADRKDRELVAETNIAVAEIQTGMDAPDIAGSVGSLR